MWVEEEQETVGKQICIFKTRERKEAAVYVLVSRLLVTHHVISVTKCGEESGGGVIKTDTTAPK